MPPWSWTGTKKIPISSIFKLENSMPGLYNTNFCNIGPPIWLLVLRCCRLGNGGGGGHRHRQNPFAGRHHKLQLVNAWALLYIFTNFYIKCMGCIIFTMRAPSNSQHFSPDLWCKTSTALCRQYAALERHKVWPLGGEFSTFPRAGVAELLQVQKPVSHSLL